MLKVYGYYSILSINFYENYANYAQKIQSLLKSTRKVLILGGC